MNRLWSRVGVRVASISLLVAGAGVGIYLGLDRDDQKSSEAQLVGQQVKVDDAQLLRQREAEHAVTRAMQRQVAQGAAAEQAALEAKNAAGRAHTVEQKAVAKRKAEEAKKKADEAKKKAEEAKAKAEAAAKKSKSSGSAAFTGDIPDSCSEFSGTREIGCALMVDAGFEIGQFSCLNKLWNKESGWNPKARNDSSGAYGIPQSLPGSKMSSEGDDWETNPATQIKWGLGYIEGRYDTPCGAWGHSQDTGWY